MDEMNLEYKQKWQFKHAFDITVKRLTNGEINSAPREVYRLAYESFPDPVIAAETYIYNLNNFSPINPPKDDLQNKQ